MFKKAPNTLFKIRFLKFLKLHNGKDVNVYDFIMKYYSSNISEISLMQIRLIVTQLCKDDLIACSNFGHNLIGVQGIPEEDQIKNAISHIRDKGLEYLRTEERNKRVFVISILALLSGITWGILKYIIK